MRKIAIPAIVAILALGGCASPIAVQVASFAADGIAYVATGKGLADHTLSAIAGGDCRISNSVRNRDVCAPYKTEASEAEAIVAALAPPREAELIRILSLAPAAGPASRAAPSANVRSSARLSFQQSAGMNLAEISGATPGSVLAGDVDDDGTLHVYLMEPGVSAPDTALFTVPGYAQNRAAFTGIIFGTTFLAPELILR